MKASPARSTLAVALNLRDWRIHHALAQRLIVRARALYAQDASVLELDTSVYALDSTTIDLCLNLFDWAPFRSTKAAIKLHTLLDLRGARRMYSAPTERTSGVICDQRIMLNGFYSATKYPEHLRRIRFKDPESGKTLVFLTHNTSLPALTIAALYKSRGQVELFFDELPWCTPWYVIEHLTPADSGWLLARPFADDRS